MMQPHLGLLTVLGLTAGLVSGFLGIGGGLVLVPALMLLFQYPIKRAVGTSLATVVVVAQAAIVTELLVKGSNIRWTVALSLIGGSLVGSLHGARLLSHIPDRLLRLGFAGLLVVASYRMTGVVSTSGGPGPLGLAGDSVAGYAWIATVGAAAGCASVWFGIGGGIVIVPGLSLLFGDISFHVARATALVTIVPTAGLGAYQHLGMGTVDTAVARHLIPGGLIGAGIGVIAANQLPPGPCRIVFAGCLVFAAIRLVTADAAACLAVIKRRVRIPLRTVALLTLVAVTVPADAGDVPGRVARSDWRAHIKAVDDALARKDVSTAEQAWHDAYLAELGSRRWEGMLEVGDAYLRIGEAAKGRKAAEPKARSVYLSALFRARRQGSLHGVLRTAEAFAALGDRQVVEQCLHIAEQLAEGSKDPHGRARVQALRDRLAGASVSGKRSDLDDPLPLLFPDQVGGP